MQVMRLASPDAFAARCEDFLSAREDMNTLILGVLCSSGGWRESAPLCVTVEEGGRLAMAGLRTPPFNLILSHGERGAAKVMAEALAQESEGLSGVIAMEDLAEAFAEAWKSAGMAAPGAADRAHPAWLAQGRDPACNCWRTEAGAPGGVGLARRLERACLVGDGLERA